ncbi:penicillin-binding transpeptidase domain-containing protein [Jeotgalibacillus haloalkalitolerans]|uniref:Penicillin-binding transpeptidase domain-containing protein n=1 Tax=Jeotgalibacillus haloalkalitolerans TaxID=3104292 RepID=A0ABU5KLP9_9BACL|nr:penicillin-binding transpeptidase domain-containing protein [Jeotgalibacillus sp. HH7-29]MDZ5712174.1 penicillin-binding transpeptidase domain-containing protein [Jeotgalibacillus sp. HH7-29]
MKKNQSRTKKAKKIKKNFLAARMNILFFAVFLLFSALILRLGVLQIVNGEDFTRQLERTEEVVVNASVPRGKIFDRNGNVIVDNRPVNAITYTKTQQTSQDEMMDVATKLADMIELSADNVQERDKQDYWIRENEERAQAKITDEERALYDEGELSQNDYDKLIRDRITEEELAEITDQEMEILAVYRQMQTGYNLSPQIIKNEDVTDEEFATVSEQLSSLPGVNTTVDWQREYPYGDVLRSVLGSVRSIPEDKIEYYLARDYARNDRVGTSYLELEYEDVLQGQKSKVRTITDKAGNVIDSQLIQQGERGKDLVLSIDIELQQALEQVVEDELRRLKQDPGRNLMDRLFLVMMDPNTGELLAMAGKQYVETEDGPEIQDYNIGTFTSAYEAGSSIKGATVLSGYQDGVISRGSLLRDEVIRIKGSDPKSSWYGSLPNPISDLYALERSSNGYMFKIAIEMAGATYRPNEPIDIGSSTFTKMRNYFGQFGLGSETGIDLPGESVGYQTNNPLDLEPGKLLDLSIGQFDTYTPMQMVQYVSTVINGGNRVAPTIVKEIREPSSDNETLGPLVRAMKPRVLNKLDNTQAELDHVKQGFYRSFNGPQGTGRDFIGNGYEAGGKTGTAEVVYFGPKYDELYRSRGLMPPETTNSTIVGFAPFDKPEVAFSVLAPWVYPNDGNSPLREDVNENVGTAALEVYFDLREKRMNEGGADQDQQVEVTAEEAEEGQ